MAAMRIMPECRACLIRLVDLAVSLASSEFLVQQAARQAALHIIDREFGPEAIPALIANHFQAEIRKITGNPDPFRAYKNLETAFLARQFEVVAAAFPQNLESLLKLAVLGNAVDFFRAPEEVRREFSQNLNFAVCHLKALKERLASKPSLMLYLADNAGEQYFDAPLVHYLRGLGWRVLYVVKGGPIQNDLTLADLTDSGLLKKLEPVIDTGAQTVGLVLSETSPAFQSTYRQAQLILAKGMGHFETLSHKADVRLFFLLQAKCRPVAQALRVPLGSFVFAHAPEICP